MHLKTLWLLNVNLLLNNAIEKCGPHIHLMDLPTHLCCNRYDQKNRSIPSYGSEVLIIIDSLYHEERCRISRQTVQKSLSVQLRKGTQIKTGRTILKLIVGHKFRYKSYSQVHSRRHSFSR